MAGPPLVTSSNVNMQKEERTKEQPSPKRRRKSITDDSNTNNLEDAQAGQDQDAAAAAETAAVATEETPDEVDQDGDGGRGEDGARASEPQPEAEEEEDEEGEEGGEEGENQDDLGDEEIGETAAEPGEEGGGGEGGGGAAGGDDSDDAPSPAAGKDDSKEKEKDGGNINIARARSAWMIFLADNREAVRKEHPGLAVGPMQKILSEMWKGLGEGEVARYAKLAAEDKERMKGELAAAGLTKLPVKNSSAASAPGGPTSLVLPLARVRKAVRLDPAVGNISKEGLLLVTKATEVFMTVVADHAWKIGRQTGRKSIRPCDVADFVFAAPEMYWLKDEFRDERSSVKKKQGKPEAGSAKADLAKKAAAAAMPKGAKPITSFFQKA